MRPIIVISAVNLRQGGGLTVLRDCLEFISESELSNAYHVIALVHKRELSDFPNIEYIEFPKSAKSWFRRIYYEYFYFSKLAKKLKPYLWLSLHDMTPNVKVERQAVYMHNASIANRLKLSDFKFDKKYIAFTLFYKYLYRINIHRNQYCIVQQDWFRNICSELFDIPRTKFIVARPKILISRTLPSESRFYEKKCFKFFYPSLPRPFKNFETVCEAASILKSLGLLDVKIIITIDGTENDYSHSVYKKYKDNELIKFVGLQTKEEMRKYYNDTDCLIFPSRLESWGLPISEFIPYAKPMIIADEPYAHETSEGAISVAFFPTNDAQFLAKLIKELNSGDYSNFKSQAIRELQAPAASNYQQLFEILLSTTNSNH